MRHDRKGSPKEIKALNDQSERSVSDIYIYISQGKKDHTGLLHQQKKSGERKVIVLSAMHENMKETKD